MPQHEIIPGGWNLVSSDNKPQPGCLHLESTASDLPVKFSIEAIRPGLFRTTFTTDQHPLPPHPSAARPRIADGEHIPDWTGDGPSRQLTLAGITAHLDWNYCPRLSLQWTNSSTWLHRDLQYRSYALDSSGIAHYSEYAKDTLHLGLGEKAAPMDLSDRHFILAASDTFGYNVHRTDPLYKHIPLIINATPAGCTASFSTSHSRGTWSVGSEIDGLWGKYKVYRQDYGGLEEYLLVGRTLRDVVRLYADLVGYPRLVPRWAFGYIAGGMKYSMLDEPRACEALEQFAEKLKEHDIPCSAFQMSSGYTVAETEPKTRNVFTWNRHRFPDPKGFVEGYHARGIRLIANVKPYVLANHPAYEKLKEKKAFFTNPHTGQTSMARLWSAGGGESGEGSHIDFTSTAGFRWWYEGVKALREVGIDCIWNDNNEYTVADDDTICACDAEDPAVVESGHGKKQIGLWGRSMQAELMAKASHDALVDSDPNQRPFILTRSATAGTMRYAASAWSGDNVTSWANMRGSTALSLNAGMSLLQCYGHDIGGFEGPQPSPELLTRWVQLGTYSPRFAINCFKTSSADNLRGDVIELWMYPAITHILRKAIKRRYELIPYLYSLALESHLHAAPPQRWTGWGCEGDGEVWRSGEVREGERQFWLGEALLVAGVFGEGVERVRVYLPRREGDLVGVDGFVNLNPPYQVLESGQWVEIDAPWRGSIAVLAKIGGVVPVGRDAPTAMVGLKRGGFEGEERDDVRKVEIFPCRGDSKGRVWEGGWWEDDGVSREAEISRFAVRYSCTEEKVRVEVWAEEGNVYRPLWEEVSVVLPVGDQRTVELDCKGLKRA